jgi:HAD superfamily hydrolase (TIGR01549 family)
MVRWRVVIAAEVSFVLIGLYSHNSSLILPHQCQGTLGDCTPALRMWCSKMTAAVQRKCVDTGISTAHAEHIISKFHESIGWDVVDDDVVPSAPLSAGTWDEIVDVSAASLYASGLTIQHQEVLEWHQDLGDIHAEDLPLIKSLPRFLQFFRHHGIIISICTSDDRASTKTCLQNWDITHLVDYSICGDEVGKECKPSPEPLFELCRRAGVSPSECLVVGDTSSDTQMGVRAGAGFVVGVLTGSGTKEQLFSTGADIVLPSIGFLKGLLPLSTEPFIRYGSIADVMDIDEFDSTDEHIFQAKDELMYPRF